MSRFTGISSKIRSVVRSTRPAHRIILLYALLTLAVVIFTLGDGILQTLAALQSALVALAAIGGVIVAAEGLDTWHKQIRGRNDYDLALKLQKSVFQLRDLLTSADTLSLEEAHSNAKDTTDTDSEPTTYVKATPRWQKEEYSQEIYSALDEVTRAQREAEVLWGPEIHRIVIPFQNYALELTNYIGYLKVRDKPRPAGFEDAPPWDDVYGDKRNPIKRSSDTLENDFQADVRAAAEKIRSHLAKYLDR